MVRTKQTFIEGVKAKLQDRFWRNNAIFFFGSLGVGLLNYLYYPILGRVMTVHQFGEVQVLFSILLDIVVVFSALSMVIVNITANAKGSYAKTNILQIEQVALSFVYVLFAVWLAVVPLLTGFLKIDSGWPVIVLYGVIFASLLISTRQAFIQGVQDFFGVTVGSLLAAGAKLLLSVIFVSLGMGVVGAILGLALGQLVGVVYVSLRSRRHGLHFPLPRFRVGGIRQVLPDLQYIIPTLLVSLSIAALYSSDTIIVKHFFAADQAGQYAAIATIGRIIFFLTGPIGLVMFASVKLSQTNRQNQFILLRSALIVAAVGGSACLFFLLFPHFTVSLLLGDRYDTFALLLPRLALALLMVSLVNLLLYYDLALRRRRPVVIGIGGLIALAYLIGLYHATVVQIVDNILFATLLMIVASLSIPLASRLVNLKRKQEESALHE